MVTSVSVRESRSRSLLRLLQGACQTRLGSAMQSHRQLLLLSLSVCL